MVHGIVPAVLPMFDVLPAVYLAFPRNLPARQHLSSQSGTMHLYSVAVAGSEPISRPVDHRNVVRLACFGMQ